MIWSGQEVDGTGPLQDAVPLEPLPDHLPWQAAGLVILTLSLLLWGVVGVGIARLIG